ncbi:hypothetical protein ZWY2020_026618 [Hordeum vulgare]|nr:hypothetical protein ZWY2020_026618 [Hordeum vulgare]
MHAFWTGGEELLVQGGRASVNLARLVATIPALAPPARTLPPVAVHLVVFFLGRCPAGRFYGGKGEQLAGTWGGSEIQDRYRPVEPTAAATLSTSLSARG